MIAALDFGNTRAKGACFDGEELMAERGFTCKDDLQEFITMMKPDRVIYATVRDTTSWLEGINVPTAQLTCHTPIPILNEYSSPETLGMDRLAAVVGAYATFGAENCLVIDMGTCITFDILTSERRYLGGAISPGVRMRFRSLHNFTGALPLVDVEENWEITGDSTVSCIQAGVLQGVVDEITSRINHYEATMENLKIVLTGGDSRVFESKIKGSIFVDSNLVLKGINGIFIHGEANE